MSEDGIVALGVLITIIALGGFALIATVTLVAMNRRPSEVVEESEHYESTACFHGHHDLCRLECKHCASPCRCDCHDDDPRQGLPTKRSI